MARAFSSHSSFFAAIPGGGTLAPAAIGYPTWGEFGVSLTYRLTDKATLTGFADGVSGDTRIATHAHFGAAFRVRF